MNNLRKSIVCIFIGALIASCGSAETKTLDVFLLTPSDTPFQVPVVTLTLTAEPLTDTHPTVHVPAATPDFCKLVLSQGKIIVVSDNIFTALGPGNPVVFDRFLAEHDPAWADFHQTVHSELRSAGVIFHETSAGPELGTAINPAVILAIYGIEQNWQLPANGDLVSEVEHIRAVLYQHRSNWIHGQVDQSQYPVANAATYALYRYFNADSSKLEIWCQTYIQVYDESPLD